MYRIAGSTLTVILFCALPAGALAQLPKPTSKLIVPGVSIGGVRLGMSLAAVRKAWGSSGISENGDACQAGRSSCIWSGVSAKERAWVEFDANAKVRRVGILGGPASPLGRLKTPQGFGLGTKSMALVTANGNRLPDPAGLGSPSGTGGVVTMNKTSFFIGRTNGTVLGVAIYS